MIKSEIRLDLKNQIIKLGKAILSNRKNPLFSGPLSEGFTYHKIVLNMKHKIFLMRPLEKMD